MKKTVKIKELVVVGNINDNTFHKWKILDEKDNYIYISGFHIQNLKNKLIELYNLITNNNNNNSDNNNIGILCNVSYSDNVKKMYLTEIYEILNNEQLLKYKEEEGENKKENGEESKTEESKKIELSNQQNQKEKKEEEIEMDDSNNNAVSNNNNSELLLKNGKIKITSIDDILSHENIMNIYKDINESMEGVVNTINDSKTYWQGKTTIDFYSNILKLIEMAEKNKYFKEKNVLDQEKMSYDNNMYKYYTEKLKFDIETLNLDIRKMSIKLAEKVIDDFKFKDIDFMDKMLLILKIGGVIERSMHEGIEVGIDLLENIKEKLTINYIKQDNIKKQEQQEQQEQKIEATTEKSKRGRKKKTEQLQSDQQIPAETETTTETTINIEDNIEDIDDDIDNDNTNNNADNNEKNEKDEMNIQQENTEEIKKSIFNKKIMF